MSNESGQDDRNAAIDAVVRFAMGLDDGDVDMLNSSMMPDAIVDLTHFNQLGFLFEEMNSREDVVKRLMKGVGQLDCTHALSNFRVSLNGDKADLTCYVTAQHFRPGQGVSNEDYPWYTMGNRYTAEVVRNGGLWQISRLVVKVSWVIGSIDVVR